MVRQGMRLVITYEPGGVGWRRPASRAEELLSVDYYASVATAAEAAKIDAVFRADVPYLNPDRIERSAGIGIEPLVLLGAIAARTSRIGLIGTASTSFTEPYNVARAFSTLDHLSAGRAGWNVVTSAFGERNFGLDALPPQDERYARAAEHLQVVRGLWRGWAPDAWLVDRQSGRFADPAGVHPLDHHGRYFDVEGPLDLPRSPQGEPLLVQAGASGPGRAFAASFAELIFTAAQSIDEGVAFRDDLRERAVAAGRSSDDLVVLPGVKTIVAGTEREAVALERELRGFVDLEAGLPDLEKVMGGVDLSGIGWDERVPADRLTFDEASLGRRQSRPALFRRLALERGYTLRRLVEEQVLSTGHRVLVGTPERVADSLEEWYRSGAADGFVVIPAVANAIDFIEGVVPELRRRGLFRHEYEADTLRGNLGLPARA